MPDAWQAAEPVPAEAAKRSSYGSPNAVGGPAERER